VEEELKTQCADYAIGKPVFVEDRRPVKNKRDYYLVPLIKDSRINAFCSVSVYDDEIAFASFDGFDDTAC
jgi:hypothetical protein